MPVRKGCNDMAPKRKIWSVRFWYEFISTYMVPACVCIGIHGRWRDANRLSPFIRRRWWCVCVQRVKCHGRLIDMPRLTNHLRQQAEGIRIRAVKRRCRMCVCRQSALANGHMGQCGVGHRHKLLSIDSKCKMQLPRKGRNERAISRDHILDTRVGRDTMVDHGFCTFR